MQDFSLNPLSVSSDSPSPFQLTSPFQKASPTTPATEVKPSTAMVDTIETAIDFVLALEAPCMPHIPYPGEQMGADPANHVMMMSA